MNSKAEKDNKPRILAENDIGLRLKAQYAPAGDQPEAIESLSRGILNGKKYQTLLGVTGSGKTFTMANVIQAVQRPTLIIAHNKTLAAQLYAEFEEFFPENAVEYFVSYYDYYQPEAYLPTTDTYIEKDSSINDEIEKLRLSATRNILTRRDTIIIASVSCIYGLGSPDAYMDLHVHAVQGEELDRDILLRKLVDVQYERHDADFARGHFRVRGDTVEIFPSYEDTAIRLEFWGDEIERISVIDPLRGVVLRELPEVSIYPAKHFVVHKQDMVRAIDEIRIELDERVKYYNEHKKPLEAERIAQRTNFDIEMLQEIGYCKGIENYSRILIGREPGQPPFTLIDYMPSDALVIIDESHVTVPQVRGMYNGDRSRKENLVEYGFRLPSALDNRPLRYEEFFKITGQTVYVSATPAKYELELSENIVEQIVRPTGLIDPKITIKPARNQVDDLIGELKQRVDRKERVLVTTLTKRMAEDLSEYLAELDFKVRYLHSTIDTLERVEIIRGLRLGEFDVLVGVNLLREGLDLPEVSLVAILDADKEGFLRSGTALVQTTGRAARNINGEVIMYADKITDSIKYAMSETDRRRKLQLKFNEDHGITPKTIKSKIKDYLGELRGSGKKAEVVAREPVPLDKFSSEAEIYQRVTVLDRRMKQAAKELKFEQAAAYRDEISELKKFLVGLVGKPF